MGIDGRKSVVRMRTDVALASKSFTNKTGCIHAMVGLGVV